MRYVFGMFWKTQFDINANNDRPDEICTMIRKAFRAMYISYHLGSVLVCVYLVVWYGCLLLCDV